MCLHSSHRYVHRIAELVTILHSVMEHGLFDGIRVKESFEEVRRGS